MLTLLLAQAPAPAAPLGIWGLFLQSFDAFTIVLLAGSVTAGAFIFRALIEVRPSAILPERQTRAMRDLVREGRIGELRGFVQQDRSFIAQVLRAALEQGGTREAMREAAELAASEQVATWFCHIQPFKEIRSEDYTSERLSL